MQPIDLDLQKEIKELEAMSSKLVQSDNYTDLRGTPSEDGVYGGGDDDIFKYDRVHSSSTSAYIDWADYKGGNLDEK